MFVHIIGIKSILKERIYHIYDILFHKRSIMYMVIPHLAGEGC